MSLKRYMAYWDYNSVKCWNLKTAFLNRISKFFQAGTIHRLCGKTNKTNRGGFDVYVDFVFVLII